MLLTKLRMPLGWTAVVLIAAATLSPRLRGDDTQVDPWPKADLMQPAALAKMLESPDTQPAIICVAFPFLYRQRHMIHAKFAGPTSKPEGLAALREVLAGLPKTSEIVIYCGCCPMEKCPNVRPAYKLAKELGFNRVRVLDIPTNFHTDWSAKGYPVE